jgi:hypothetical protein
MARHVNQRNAASISVAGRARGSFLLRCLGRVSLDPPQVFAGGSRGQVLLETAVALSVFALVGTAVLVGVSLAHTTGSRVESQSVAENLARNQMEYVFSQPYQAPPAAYPTVSAPDGYTVSAVAEEYVLGDPNVEKVVVTVNRDGQSVLVLETLRTRE